MAELMQRGPVPVDRLEIGLRRRYANEVAEHVVVGALPADAEVGAGGRDQRLDPRLDERCVSGRRCRRQLGRQAVALLDVEDGEALEEVDRAGVLARLLHALAFLAGDEAVSVDDGRAALALAHIAAERERLAEGEPALAGVAALDDSTPEDQDVDPGVAPTGCGVLRQGEWRVHTRGSPGLHPGQAPGLEFGDDPVGDLVVEGRAVTRGSAARGRPCRGAGHGGSP